MARPIAALADLQGPKFRLGNVSRTARIGVAQGDVIRLDLRSRRPETYAAGSTAPSGSAAGCFSLARTSCVDDGRVRLTVKADRQRLGARPQWSPAHTLSDHKGLAIPGVGDPGAGDDRQGSHRPRSRPAHRRGLDRTVVRAAGAGYGGPPAPGSMVAPRSSPRSRSRLRCAISTPSLMSATD